MLRNVVLVGVGGMLGSIARYALALHLTKRLPLGFPYGTLTVNVVGCFIIGVVLGLVSRSGAIASELRLLLATGFCGGFTTMSSFTYEVIELAQTQHYALTVIYVLGTMLLSILATLSGLLLTR